MFPTIQQPKACNAADFVSLHLHLSPRQHLFDIYRSLRNLILFLPKFLNPNNKCPSLDVFSKTKPRTIGNKRLDVIETNNEIF